MTETIYSVDLSGIQVGQTAISNVDGANGALSYRGVSIDELVQRPFWQVVWLVICGRYPSVEEESALSSFMSVNSSLSKRELTLLTALPDGLHPMLMLQSMFPALDLTHNHRIEGISEDALKGLIIASKVPTLIAAHQQMELGNNPVKPNAEAGFHENFLMMFTGKAATAEQIHTLNVTQILQLEHSFNAGTFAGRVCASTLAPIQSSIVASIATLSGILHGGADQAALEMAQSLAGPEDAEAYVQDCLKNKIKVMGMGHREYKVLDPRASILKPMAKTLCASGDSKRLFDTLVAVESACQQEFAKKDKAIWANVEFYKGAVFHQLGIPSHYFTSVFAMARVFGYVAHYHEFSTDSRLIRPSAKYIGA